MIEEGPLQGKAALVAEIQQIKKLLHYLALVRLLLQQKITISKVVLIKWPYATFFNSIYCCRHCCSLNICISKNFADLKNMLLYSPGATFTRCVSMVIIYTRRFHEANIQRLKPVGAVQGKAKQDDTIHTCMFNDLNVLPYPNMTIQKKPNRFSKLTHLKS